MMQHAKFKLTLLALIASMASATAWAEHRGGFHHGGGHRGHIGVFIGAPLFWPWYYPPAYYPYSYYPYSYPPVVVTPSPPPVYVERSDQEFAPAPQAQFWYYCENPQGYYPTVRECPVGWQQVPARPPRS